MQQLEVEYHASLSCPRSGILLPGNHGWRVAREALNNLCLGGREVRGRAHKIDNLNGENGGCGM